MHSVGYPTSLECPRELLNTAAGCMCWYVSSEWWKLQSWVYILLMMAYMRFDLQRALWSQKELYKKRLLHGWDHRMPFELADKCDLSKCQLSVVCFNFRCARIELVVLSGWEPSPIVHRCRPLLYGESGTCCLGAYTSVIFHLAE